jgi:hypothetical protein
MRRAALALLLLATVTPGCQRDQGRAGRDAAAAASDAAVVRDAQAGVDGAVRQADDCEAARAALPGALRKLEEAAEKIQTQEGRASLDALRAQVNRVSRACQ